MSRGESGSGVREGHARKLAIAVRRFLLVLPLRPVHLSGGLTEPPCARLSGIDSGGAATRLLARPLRYVARSLSYADAMPFALRPRARPHRVTMRPGPRAARLKRSEQGFSFAKGRHGEAHAARSHSRTSHTRRLILLKDRPTVPVVGAGHEELVVAYLGEARRPIRKGKRVARAGPLFFSRSLEPFLPYHLTWFLRVAVPLALCPFQTVPAWTAEEDAHLRQLHAQLVARLAEGASADSSAAGTAGAAISPVPPNGPVNWWPAVVFAHI